MKKKDKWGKKQVIYLEAIPYKQECVVILNGSFQDVIKEFKKINTTSSKRNLDFINEHTKEVEEGEKNSIHSLGKTYVSLPVGFAMVIKHQESWVNTVATVSHECLHLTNYIMRRVDIPLTTETEEAYTYLQAYLLKEILHKLY